MKRLGWFSGLAAAFLAAAHLAVAQVGAPVAGAGGPFSGTYSQAQQIASGQALATPVVLAKSSIPFIALSTGSVSAGGAISAITALPRAYSNAYCYFPASILATSGQGSTAGFYYCTFSTTTAGTAFLNPYTTGPPTIPSSPTAVTTGQGAFTGVTTEIFGPQITLPANALGANGGWRVRWWHATTNSAGTKACNVRWSGTGGTVVRAIVLTTSVMFQDDFYVFNRGATNVQSESVATTGGSFTANAGAETAIAVDTTAATTIVLGSTRNTATDNHVILGYVIELLSDGT